MSSEDFSSGGLRVGRWLPDTPIDTPDASGTVYRGGSLAVSQLRVEAADGTPGEAPDRRGFRIAAGLALAVGVLALSTTTLLATNRPEAAREVGTMQYPVPVLPGPPALLPLSPAPSGPAERSAAPSTTAGSAAPVASRPSTVVTHGPDGSPAPVVVQPTVSAPVSPTAAGPAPTSRPSQPEPSEVTVPLAAGATVSLETMTRPGHLVRHDSARAVVGRVGLGSSPEERASARFVVRTGLADPRCVSFESEDRPGRFLRHRNFAVYLHRYARDSLYAKDATFCPVAGADGRHTSLRSQNYPDRYLTVRSSLLFLDRADGAAETRSFAVRPGA